MSRLLGLLICVVHLAESSIVLSNLGLALEPEATQNLNLQSGVDNANADIKTTRCVGFRYWQNGAAVAPAISVPNVPIAVTSASLRLRGFRAALPGPPAQAAETARVTIRADQVGAAPAVPGFPGAVLCTFNDLTGLSQSDITTSNGETYTTAMPRQCLLPTTASNAVPTNNPLYFLCVEALSGAFQWERGDADAAAAVAALAASMDVALGTGIITDRSMLYSKAINTAALFVDQVESGMFRLEGVLSYSPSPVTTPRPSPSPVRAVVTTPASEGSDSALYGLFALIALPVLLAIAALAACWYYLTRRPAGLELQEQVPRQYQQVPPPTPAPAVPYFPSVYAPGAYMPAPGMVMPPAYAF